MSEAPCWTPYLASAIQKNFEPRVSDADLDRFLQEVNTDGGNISRQELSTYVKAQHDFYSRQSELAVRKVEWLYSQMDQPQQQAFDHQLDTYHSQLQGTDSLGDLLSVRAIACEEMDQISSEAVNTYKTMIAGSNHDFTADMFSQASDHLGHSKDLDPETPGTQTEVTAEQLRTWLQAVELD